MDVTEPRQPPPFAENIEWPELVRACERIGLPVSRVDENGVPHLIRSLEHLRDEWEAVG